MSASADQQDKNNKKKTPWINWRFSEAKEVLLADLENRVLPLDDKVCPAFKAWELYKRHEAFSYVPFDQFKVRLKDHREQVQKEIDRGNEDAVALERDRRLHPRRYVNHRGELVFDLSPAKYLLREDVQNKKIPI